MVEFREKLDVRNPGDVDAGSRVVVVVLSELAFVIGGVLTMEVVSLPELVLEAGLVTFGELELGADEVLLDVEGASLGASSPDTPLMTPDTPLTTPETSLMTPDTSLMTPDTTEFGSPVATLAISDIGSEIDADINTDRANPSGL